MAELLPCPFCGGGVYCEDSYELYNKKYHVECLKCGMVFEYQEKHEPLTIDYIGIGEKRIYYNNMMRQNKPFLEAWNTRTPKERGGEK